MSRLTITSVNHAVNAATSPYKTSASGHLNFGEPPEMTNAGNLHQNAAATDTIRMNMMRHLNKHIWEETIMEVLNLDTEPVTYREIARRIDISPENLGNIISNCLYWGKVIRYIDHSTGKTSYKPRFRRGEITPLTILSSPWKPL
jgi:hypothetical protein